MTCWLLCAEPESFKGSHSLSLFSRAKSHLDIGLFTICNDKSFLWPLLLHDDLRETIAKLDLVFQCKKYLNPGEKRTCLEGEVKYRMKGTVL